MIFSLTLVLKSAILSSDETVGILCRWTACIGSRVRIPHRTAAVLRAEHVL